MTKHAAMKASPIVEERHRRRVYELSRELLRIMLDGDGSQDTEIAHDAAIAQALADIEAAGRLAGLEQAAKWHETVSDNYAKAINRGAKAGFLDSQEARMKAMVAHGQHATAIRALKGEKP